MPNFGHFVERMMEQALGKDLTDALIWNGLNPALASLIAAIFLGFTGHALWIFITRIPALDANEPSMTNTNSPSQELEIERMAQILPPNSAPHSQNEVVAYVQPPSGLTIRLRKNFKDDFSGH